MPNSLSPLLWFLFIVAAIPLVLWLLKRTPLGGGTGGAGLRSVSALPLSASQRVVTVEVGTGEGRRWLVLGVTPSSIQTLYTMDPVDEPSPAPAAAPPSAAFAQLLGRLRNDGKGHHAP
ncbi:MAG: flagellar biosynthetic protein FliO [Rubrivivax sp.]|nr:flagellar biosynthetic protein FliO [Rubrivivax sp.]